MRFGPEDKFWVVVDPKEHSRQEDIVFQASLRDLELQLRGGLTIEENPTLFTDEQEAELEAYGRLTAMRAAQAIARSGAGPKLQSATRLEIYDANGTILFGTDLPGSAM